jgi:tetratricopeptide (TPR) repeat protein
MGRALARKKLSGEKPQSAVRPGQKLSENPRLKSESSHRKAHFPSGALKKSQQKTLMKTEKKGVKPATPPISEETKSTEAVTRNPAVTSRISPSPETPPRLLRDSKTTAAALALLERGIKLIYQKDFRKARAEFKSLIETHPGEPEIVARARTYIQICDREEVAHKKPAITNDQLYTLGVMEHNCGNYEAAISYFHQSLEQHPNADYIFYSIAASLALKGSVPEAIQNLRKAIELKEENRIYAKNDTDFVPLHSQKDFADLVGMSPAPNHESQQ